MTDNYLASGFADVDGGDDEVFSGCLECLESLPYFQSYKAATYRYLGLKPGLSVLDAGCGLGHDGARMCELVAPDGLVVGVDSSVSMTTKARERWGNRFRNLTFTVADARNLPFPANHFDRCRVDRVLQHIVDPQTAVTELFRILKSDGLALAYDNDWGTFAIRSMNQSIDRMIQDEWSHSFTNPRIGRDLGLFFEKAGFTVVNVHSCVSTISDFETADKVYTIDKTLNRLVAASKLDREDAHDWLAELRRQTTEGVFQTTLTANIVIGRKG